MDIDGIKKQIQEEFDKDRFEQERLIIKEMEGEEEVKNE